MKMKGQAGPRAKLGSQNLRVRLMLEPGEGRGGLWWKREFEIYLVGS